MTSAVRSDARKRIEAQHDADAVERERNEALAELTNLSQLNRTLASRLKARAFAHRRLFDEAWRTP